MIVFILWLSGVCVSCCCFGQKCFYCWALHALMRALWFPLSQIGTPKPEGAAAEGIT